MPFRAPLASAAGFVPRDHWRTGARAWTKWALWRVGALAALHRARNRHRLTVVMFHRVLPRAAPGWDDADPAYTVSDDLFGVCLRFFKRHYHVVDLDTVLTARREAAALPPWPLLITLDDGWADTEAVALPILRAQGVPAALFAVSDGVQSDRRLWWQELVVAAARLGRFDETTEAALWRAVGGSSRPALPASERPLALLTALATLDEAEREKAVAPLAKSLDPLTPRHLLTPWQLRRLPRAGVAVGCHGASHAPLPALPDLDSELAGARRALGALLEGSEPAALSFPHGRYSPQVVAAARAAGFELLFTSDRRLNPIPDGRLRHDLLGRISIPAPEITGPDGRLMPELLALRLFTAPTMDPPPGDLAP